MSRRQFIQQLLLGAAAPLGALNLGWLSGTAHAQSGLLNRRLVLVELAGANDGLNTLVPFRDDNYYRKRPTLGLRGSNLRKLDAETGVNASLEPLLPLWEAGDMAWVRGLGYPSANRSHFTSTALWETAGDGRSQRTKQGWMTAAIEHRYSHLGRDPHGISLAGNMGIFGSDTGRWMSLQSIEKLNPQELPVQDLDTDTRSASLALVQRRIGTLNSTLSSLAAKVERGQEIDRFAAGPFGEQLRQVAKMIAAGVDTPVYRVQLSGFDTHEYQQGQHARLLELLALGLADFSDVLKSFGEWDNTIVMTYSEFGRRVAENNSAGTDHGTAAPHMVIGGAVNGGLYSEQPSLQQLVNEDMQYSMDYRALYRSVLTAGLGIEKSAPYLQRYSDDRLVGLINPA